MQSLPWRGVGKTEASVPVFGFGAAPIGNLYKAMPDEAGIGLIHAALEGGFRYFDTAPYYGFGMSERRLGAALAHWSSSEAVVISTKVGRVLTPVAPAQGDRHGFVDADPYEPDYDYSYDGVMRSFEGSCARLGRSEIDIIFTHDLGTVTHGEEHARHYRDFCESGFRALAELRKAGQIKAIGIGANEWEIGLAAMADVDLDCFLLAGRYTLLEQNAAEMFLPEAMARDVSIIIGGPFNSGILAADLSDPDSLHYNYAAAPEAVIDRVRRLHAACKRFGTRLTAAALQFPLAHPAIASVIPGLSTLTELEQAITDIGTDIPDGLWPALRDEGLIDNNAPVPGMEAA